MRKFKFGLESYLKIKKFEERACLIGLSKVLSKISQHQEYSQRYFSETDGRLKIEAAHMRQGKLMPEEIITGRRYFTQLKRHKDFSDKEVKKLQPLAEKEREKVQDAHKKVRLLEVLRAKRYKEYLKQIEKEETQMLDEFNQRR